MAQQVDVFDAGPATHKPVMLILELADVARHMPAIAPRQPESLVDEIAERTHAVRHADVGA